MQEIRQFQNYQEFKQAFDREARNQAAGFIRMGYLLKVARDTNVLYESGYRSISEFARHEYGLTDDAVSRMIAVNDRYSEGGYSDRLASRYVTFGSSLLSEMLTLSDEVIHALPDGITRAEIREIKTEIREEQKITDMEVILEEPDPGQQWSDSSLSKVLYQYYRENPEEYRELHEELSKGKLTEKSVMELLAPCGMAVKMVRIAGTGKLMLTIKGENQLLELVNIRTNETQMYDWTECIDILTGMRHGKDYKSDWEECCGEPFPEIEPAQEPDKPKERLTLPKKQEKKPEKKPKETKQQKTEEIPEETEQESVAEGQPDIVEEPSENQKENHEETLAEEQVIQMNVEEFPQYLPENYQKTMNQEENHGEQLWKEAAGYAVRLFNTLEAYEWTPESGRIVKDMCQEAEKLREVLKKLDAYMEETR